MKLIGLGANLPQETRTPVDTLQSALSALAALDVTIIQVSSWWESAPVPVSDQPWYANGVAEVDTKMPPETLLNSLLSIERKFGRVRSVANAARTLDLDLLDYDGLIMDGPPTLPHPRLHERAFVLYPLSEIAPEWRHPLSSTPIDRLIAALPGGQEIRRVDAVKAQELEKPL